MGPHHRRPGLRTRLRIALTLGGALLAISGLFDAIRVLFAAPHFLYGVPDGLTFIILAVILYGGLGLFLGVGLGSLPLHRILNDSGEMCQKLVALYGSLLLALITVSATAVRFISFSVFDANLYANLARIATLVGGGGVLAVAIYRLLVATRLTIRAYDRLAAWLRRSPAWAGAGVLVLVVGSNLTFGESTYSPDLRARHRPNVLLISLDTLGARHMSSYGYDRATTPNLDRLAREGVLFERAFSHSKWTLPSHMSMLTSTYPALHQVIDPEHVLDEGFVTLAQLLRAHGYVCGAFVDRDRFGHVGAAHGFDRGFDFYEHYPEGLSAYEKFFVVNHGLNFAEMVLARNSVPVMHSEKITDHVLDWLKNYDDPRPFFLFLHYYDIHSEAFTKLPYVAPSPYDTLHYPDYRGDFTGCGENGPCATLHLKELARQHRSGVEVITEENLRYIVSLYDGGISYVDHHMGQLFDGLKAMNLDENTLVIVTSDHGEEFLEHGLFLHGQYYDEIIHVPLIVRLPGVFPEGKRVSGLASHIDIMPTVLDVLSIEGVSQIQGRSLLPLIHDRSQVDASPPAVFGGLDKTVRQMIPLRFVRTDSFKLIYQGVSSADLAERELYDLIQDPAESKNLIDQRPRIRQRLEQRLWAWEQACERRRNECMISGTSNRLKVKKKTLEELKSLGYIN